MPKHYQRDSDGTNRVVGGAVVIAIITVACLVMALFLRHGLPTGNTLAERMALVSAHPIAWPLAWLPWMASAVGLLLFCSWLRHYAPRSSLRFFGVTLVAIGVVPDITAELIYAAVLPRLTDSAAAERFYDFELIATLLTGFAANGAYCLGGLMLNLALFRNRRFPRLVAWAGLPAWILGLGLSVAVINGEMHAAMVLTGASMTLNLIWMAIVTAFIFPVPDRYRWQRA
ncbi:MAG: hypothetical protein ACLGHO_00935 [Gammaproteobacteria bacterium]